MTAARPRGRGPKRASPGLEAARLLLASAAGLYAFHIFLHDGIVGGDDARWYAAVVADHLQQWREGLWPVFVGQTRFAPIGTVVPLRVAPLLQHVTVLLDLATFRTLSPFLLLNLAMAASGAAAGLSSYLCLRTILPGRRAEALLISILYLWSPGCVGLAYTGQLFMSVMTLPFLPIAFLGIYRVFKVDDFSGWALAVAGCAACWLAHSPIGLWVSAMTAVSLAVRWACGLGWTQGDARRALGAALLFVALCGYVFVSASTLTPTETGHIPRQLLIQNVRNTFPAVVLPVSPIASYVTDLQLGWSLYAVLLSAVVFAVVSRKPVLWALAVASLVLAFLALPVPEMDRWLWLAVPQSFIDITNAAPTQRLYAVLAAGVATLAAACLAAGPKWNIRVVGLLSAAVIWSGVEIRPFLTRGHAISISRPASDNGFREENLQVTRYSLGMLSYENRFFSNGVMDFALEQRVLGPDLRTYVVTNVGSLAPGHDFGRRSAYPRLPGVFIGSSPPGEKIWINLDKKLTLEPGASYLLALDFNYPDWPGILQITGGGILREYSLPSSGMPFAFGSGKLSSRVIPLRNDTKSPIELTVAFINQDTGADLTRTRDFARYDLLRFDPDKLPIRLKSMAPYVAEVDSPSPGWLETFRYFTPGWTAIVNGKPVPVRRSWNGLVAVPIGAGESEVRLAYHSHGPLLASYWLMCFSWAALVVWAVRRERIPQANIEAQAYRG